MGTMDDGRSDGPKNVFMDRWTLGPKVQKIWDSNHAIWFTLMGIGGGIFILDRILGLTAELDHWLGLPLAKVVSLVVIAIGGVVLIVDLGRPLHFWKAFLNVRTSWISRGAWAHLFFMSLGFLLILPELRIGDAAPFAALPWDANGTTALGRALVIVTGVAGFVVMFYAGAVLARPRAIPYWHSVAIPVQFVLSSAAMAMGCLLVLAVAADMELTAGLMGLLAILSAALLVSVVAHLIVGRDRPGKRESLEALLRGRHRTSFVFGVVVAGTVVPMVLALVALPAAQVRDVVAIVSFVLLVAGGFGLRLITLRVGIFPPVHEVGSTQRPARRATGAR